jgi:putative endonuclease
MISFLRRQFNRSDAPSSSGALGAYGEGLVAEYLTSHGYRLVAANYTAPIGRSLSGRVVTGEIDLIAYDESGAEPVLAFIEVKTRSRADYALPQAAVDRRKQRQILRASRVYRRLLQLGDEPHRYDVASVIVSQKLAPEIMLLKGYFSESTFARSSWSARGEANF